MSRWVESLEGRRLFDTVSTAYVAVLADDTVLQNAALSAKITINDDRANIAADVRALGKSAANTRLLAKVQSAATHMTKALTSATSRFVAGITPSLEKIDSYDSLFEERLTLALNKALRATQGSTLVREAKLVAPLTTAIDTAGAPLATALAALGAANTGATASQLTADIATATTDEQSITTADMTELTQLQTDVTTLVQ